MTKYFFHFRFGDETIVDDRGVDLGSPDEAYRFAIRLIHKTCALVPVVPPGWRVDVVDEDARPIMTVLVPRTPTGRQSLRALAESGQTLTLRA